MIELLTEWLPLLLAGFATGAVLAARVRARRDRADVALELVATQRTVATCYAQMVVNALALKPGEPDPGVIRSLANLVALGWLRLDELPTIEHLRSRVRTELENREHDQRLERLRAGAAKLHASMQAVHRATVQDY